MLKVEKQFVLREIAGDYVIIPVGENALEFNGMIAANSSGAMMWEMLVAGTDEAALLNAMLDKYEVSEEEAEKDIKEFLKPLLENNIILEIDK